MCSEKNGKACVLYEIVIDIQAKLPLQEGSAHTFKMAAPSSLLLSPEIWKNWEKQGKSEL